MFKVQPSRHLLDVLTTPQRHIKGRKCGCFWWSKGEQIDPQKAACAFDKNFFAPDGDGLSFHTQRSRRAVRQRDQSKVRFIAQEHRIASENVFRARAGDLGNAARLRQKVLGIDFSGHERAGLPDSLFGVFLPNDLFVLDERADECSALGNLEQWFQFGAFLLVESFFLVE